MITKTAFNVAITAKNITAGFVATGIWPIITDIFGEIDFQPSQVTDHVFVNSGAEQASNVAKNPEIGTTIPNIYVDVTRNKNIVVGEHSLNEEPQNSLKPIAFTSAVCSSLYTTSKVFLPEVFRPIPDAPPRKDKQTNRRKIKSVVLTDPPIKNEIPAMEACKKMKAAKNVFLVKRRNSL